jgi:hypothetical protein
MQARVDLLRLLLLLLLLPLKVATFIVFLCLFISSFSFCF